MGFLRQVTKVKEKRLKDGSWQKVASEKVLQGAGTQLLHNYLDMRQVAVVGWVALRLIFEICVTEIGCKGGGNYRSCGGDRRKRINS